MSPRLFTLTAAALTGALLATFPISAALACSGGCPQTGGKGGGHHGGWGGCKGCGVTVNKPVTINKNINIFKPTTITKNVNVYKPTTITNNISVYKPITIDKSINITKYIDNSKSININKSIVINKGGGSAQASAFAAAMASASANATAVSNVTVYGGGYYEYVTVNNRVGGEISGIQTVQQCQMQEANVVKAIHAVCVSPDGREFAASHMTGQTWIDSSYEDEILRCIPGSRLKVTIGDVLQSDQGLAGTYASGHVLECGAGEALRHFKGGMLKCVPAVPVPDCTERANLRKFGTGDLFFSYRASVCVVPQSAGRETRELDVTGMTLEGGVGDGGGS